MTLVRLDLQQYLVPDDGAGVVTYYVPDSPGFYGGAVLTQLVQDFLDQFAEWEHRGLGFETTITQQPNITRARIDVATRDGRRAQLLVPLTNSASSMHTNAKEVGELYQVVLRGRDNPPAQLRHLADYAGADPRWTYTLRRDETTAVKCRILQEFLNAYAGHRITWACTQAQDSMAPGYFVVDAFTPAGKMSLFMHLAPGHQEQLQQLKSGVERFTQLR
jgi:hypothetical protein